MSCWVTPVSTAFSLEALPYELMNQRSRGPVEARGLVGAALGPWIAVAPVPVQLEWSSLMMAVMAVRPIWLASTLSEMLVDWRSANSTVASIALSTTIETIIATSSSTRVKPWSPLGLSGGVSRGVSI